MRVGGGTEGGAVVIAKCCIIDISISDIIRTVWPEDPIGVRYAAVVKISIASIRHVVKVGVVIPPSDNHADVGNILHEIVLVPIFNGEPLFGVNSFPHS